MSFLEDIFARLEKAGGPRTVLEELREGGTVSADGRQLLEKVAAGPSISSESGLSKGDRVALLAHNSIDWVAIDLAIMAEGLIVVPLYARQAPAELVAMMKDCAPALIVCGDAGLRDGIAESWADAPKQVLMADLFGGHIPTLASQTTLR